MADPEAKPKPHIKPPKPLHGILVEISPPALVVRTKGKPASYTADAACVVTLNKAQSSINQLLVGDNLFLVQDVATELVTVIDARRETND